MMGIFRLLATAALAATLASCGFHPVYAPGGGQQGAQMSAVFVDIIPNRNGQLLRQALQQRLEGTDGDVAKRFTLSILYLQGNEALGIQSDNSSTRTRVVGNASWVLRLSNPPSTQMAAGKVRSVDGYNVIDEQFFYSDLEEDATERRVTEALADQIAQAVAMYFRKHPQTG